MAPDEEMNRDLITATPLSAQCLIALQMEMRHNEPVRRSEDDLQCTYARVGQPCLFAQSDYDVTTANGRIRLALKRVKLEN